MTLVCDKISTESHTNGVVLLCSEGFGLNEKKLERKRGGRLLLSVRAFSSREKLQKYP